MKVLKHILISGAALFLILGVPLLASDRFAQIVSGQTDAVSGATVTLAQPSGNYMVLISTKEHSDPENLTTWNSFFTGGDFTYIFDDVSCIVASGDAGAGELARSYQSQLPQHQMKVMTEDSVMVLSRADAGDYDMIVMSDEFADAYRFRENEARNTEVIHVKGGNGES